jgi:hypothetical protein
VRQQRLSGQLMKKIGQIVTLIEIGDDNNEIVSD